MKSSKIEETENNIKKLESKDKSKNNSSQFNQSNEGHGKLFLVGAIIFVPAVILISILVISKARKKKRVKN